MAAITAAISGGQVEESRAQQGSNSVGTEPPKLKAPPQCRRLPHAHLRPARFPMPPNPRAAVGRHAEHYRLLQKRIGTTARRHRSAAQTTRPTTG